MVEFRGINLMNRVKPIPDTISQREIFDYGEEIENSQDRALFYFLFLTGTRISEALQVQVRDFYMTVVDLGQKRVKAIAINLITLKKRKGIPRRTVYVNPVGEDKKMLDVINLWRNNRVSNDSLLFDYGEIKKNTNRARWRAYHRIHDKLMFQVKAMQPNGKMVLIQTFRPTLHFMRHCRADNLRKAYGYDAKELQVFFNWSSTAPAEIYTHATPSGLLEKMVGRSGGIIIEEPKSVQSQTAPAP